MRIWKQIVFILVTAMAHAMLTLFLMGNAMVCAEGSEHCVTAIPRFLDYIAEIPVFAIFQLIDPPDLHGLPHPPPQPFAYFVVANSLSFAVLLYVIVYGISRVRGRGKLP
jgi:hypothetical protein